MAKNSAPDPAAFNMFVGKKLATLVRFLGEAGHCERFYEVKSRGNLKEVLPIVPLDCHVVPHSGTPRNDRWGGILCNDRQD